MNNGGGTSGQGETCTRTFDCASGLICEQGVCFPKAGAPSGDGGAVADGGDGGTGMTTGPHLGQLHESCQTTRDCESPYECINQECSVVNWGLTATGKTCGECNTGADCCELPVGFNPGFLEYDISVDGGGFIFNELNMTSVRCQDLATFIGDTTQCANAASLPIALEDVATACFYYNTYCAPCMANNPWTCTNNSCVYTAPCTALGTTVAERAAACPSQTRLGRGLSTLCNATDGGAGACSAGCQMDSDCAGKVPLGTGHVCSAVDAGGGGDCICGPDKACYFSCKSDLDCAAGKTCDTTNTHLCKTGGCMTDADCIQSLGNPNGKCMMNTCTISCVKDTDCSPPSTICSAGFCKASGCTSDVDCTGGGAHAFCVTPTNTMTTPFSSAITN